MNKIFFITGSTGFIGRNLMNDLSSKGIYSRIVLRKKKTFTPPKNWLIESIIYSKNIFNENVDWWKKALIGIDTVIHLAWYVEHGKYLNSFLNLECSAGTLNLAIASANVGVNKFVGIGTCFEYDLSQKYLSTKTPLKSNSIYSATKVALFNQLKFYFKLKKMQFNWCRLFYLYGDGESENRLYPYITKMLKDNKNIELQNKDFIRDYINVKSATKEILEISLQKKYFGPVNICSAFGKSIENIAIEIAKPLNKEHLIKFSNKKSKNVDIDTIVGIKDINYK